MQRAILSGRRAILEDKFKDDAKALYAFEELCAEMGAAMICAEYGIVGDHLQHESYIDSWFNALKRDPSMLLSAETLKLRIKDKHATVLNQLARQVNFVWNYCNDLCFKHLQRTGKFFSAFDLHAYTKVACLLYTSPSPRD